ncbi:MAG: hypothetical protein ACUVRL_05190 [Candidatus Saccharicenans sp.]|uniref:hypothetical protein n=1 Tax=Candidatus Saccharicenans sp. TaxID=2819258 RepID=UPI00404B537C
MSESKKIPGSEQRNGSFIRRREFFQHCGRCALLAASGLVAGKSSSQAQQPALMDLSSLPVKKKARVRLLFALHQPRQDRPDWPNLGFDFRPVMENYLSFLEKKLPEFSFLTATASGAEETARILEEDRGKGIEGYVVFQLNCWNRVVQPVVETGQPVLYVDFQYGGSGGFLVYTASLIREKRENFGFICSSEPAHLAEAVRTLGLLKTQGPETSLSRLVEQIRRKLTPAPGFLTCYPDQLNLLSPEETLYRMNNSTILLFRDHKGGEPLNLAGIRILNLPFSDLNAAWEKADREEAREIARGWWKKAALVQNVKFSELVNSAAMYLGMKALLRQHQAMAITINCLGGFYGGHIQAYPCLGFHELNNQGLVGACEADLRSTATMVAFSLMTGGRPGYISDPVIDIAGRHIIYAHCVASNRVFGPGGPANPFEILTHSEDRQGASVRSLMPAGYLTTSLEIDQNKKEILLHQAKTVGNAFDDRACRTKLVAEPLGDLEKLFTMWDLWGWHRVTFYGDLKPGAAALAAALGYQLVEEA